MLEATHQLAAIMFTDIVGYTTLMGEAEQRAIRLLDKNLSIQKPLIEQHQGKLLKEIGDGLLSSFNSVIEAVKCAIEIQDKLKDDPELNIRVGIHLGDVLFRDGDVLGDGVNIASRIESLASSGEILVSESVYNSIKNQEGIHTEFVKEEKLKNVVEPVKIYKVSAEIIEHKIISDSASASSQPGLTTAKPFDKRLAVSVLIGAIIILVLAYFLYNQNEEAIDKSIAVLPFKNMSDNSDQQHFADGVMEDILTQLQRMGELRVTSRTSVEQYRNNTTKTVPEIGAELRVGYLLEGSVRKAGDQIMITAQLINVADDRHLWSENYISKYTVKDIFEIQSKIAKKIVNDLKLTISTENLAQITHPITENTIAYEHFQKGRGYMRKGTDQNIDSSIVELKKAIQIDPGFASAYRLLADTYPVILPVSNTAVAGSRFEGDLFITAAFSAVDLKMVINRSSGYPETSDEEVEIIDGKGKISFTTKPGAYNKNGLAEKKFMTYITMNDSTYEYEHTYFVVKPIYKIQSAAISSLYLNCGNELMVNVPSLGTSYNPNFKTTGAINIKGAKNGQVTIIPNASKVTLTVSNGGNVIGTEHFTAMKVPNPNVQLSSRGRPINLKMGVIAPGPASLDLKAVPDEAFASLFPKDASYRVIEFDIILMRGSEQLKVESIKGRESASLIDFRLLAQPGDRFVIEVKKVARANYQNKVENLSRLPNAIFIIPLL